jgi:tetratricopeptide (TPR) repeat protein
MKADEQFLQELINESERLIENNELDEARKLLLEILQKHDPENIDAANNYAVTEIMLGNYESAEDLLKQILEKDAVNEIAILNFNYIKDIITRKDENYGILKASVKENSTKKDEVKMKLLDSKTNLAQIMTPTEKFFMSNHSTKTTKIQELILEADEFYLKGNYKLAFNNYNELLNYADIDQIELLAKLYEKYKKMPFRDRYHLYQNRYFDFKINKGDKV